MRRLVKGVLNPVLFEDPGVTLTTATEVVVMKRQKKMNSTKRDKYKSQAVMVLDLGRGQIKVLVRVPVGEGDRLELLGVGVEGAAMAENVIGDGNCGYQVVVDFVFGDEHQL
ncbi:hypothetical protein M9H77_30419 [Catharanthus roseus]|uniref:Uncharacterized protein n=1 Tax=Catharanthus roseus TaxID=4058 RepID=A0ACB9ZX77_CATRO|nr:hypothetical protein M9H77_30419 [Catharanthus roseus]